MSLHEVIALWKYARTSHAQMIRLLAVLTTLAVILAAVIATIVAG